MGANATARLAATTYVLWGLVHVAGAGIQLATLSTGGGGALGALVSTARPYDPQTNPVPAVAGAFMGMGAFNLLWIGLLVTWIAATMNWKNSPTGYWLNLGIVGATDLGLLLFLLLPGTMAWSDGSIGLLLFLVAAVLSTIALVGSGRRRSPATATV